MPKESKKKILITSALPYVNNIPHLGNIIGCVLSADVFARYCRLQKYEILFICGTDEHGTATETKAIEENLTPQQIVDKYFKIHDKIYKWFNCSFDFFGRTSTKQHTKLTQDIFLKLNKNKYIVQKEVEQLFCKICNKFLADRYVQGSCPHCEYEHARGDQCENCGKLLNAVELKNPRCKVCDSVPQTKTSDHLFIDLQKLQPKIEKWVEKQSKKGFWTENATRTTKAWLKEGLKTRAISRDLTWGVQIPLKGFENKVFYVWFDAPIGYISITECMTKKWKQWWQNKNVSLYQFMAKDNIPFHTILFPASLIGSKDPWTLLHHINSTEYLNYETGKFSKSRHEGVFGDDAMSSGIPSDVWRYYLLINRPQTADTKFTWEDFQKKNNNELVANLGNLVNRTITFLNRFFNSKVPEGKLEKEDNLFLDKIKNKITGITSLLEQVKEKEALKEVMATCSLGNQYFQKNEPWQNKKTAPTTLFILTNLVKDLAILIEPFLPETSENIFKQLNEKKLQWNSLGKPTIKKNHKVNKAELLFKKLEDKEILNFKEKFSGKTKHIEDPFSKLNIKVAEIEKVENHPNADKLYVLNINLGKEKRTIVAGLKDYYDANELKGKHICVLTNLEPAKLRGIKSQGMLLAAEKGKDVKLLEAPNSAPGSRVFIKGIEPKNDIIKFNEFKEIQIKTKDKKVLYNNKYLQTYNEEVIVNIGDNALVR